MKRTMKRRVFLIKGGRITKLIPNIILGIDPTANIVRKNPTEIEVEVSSEKKEKIEKLLLKWSADYHLEFYLLR